MEVKSASSEELKFLYKKGEYSKCLSLSDEVIESNPSDPLGYEYKCLSLLAEKKYEESLSFAPRAIRLSSPKINGQLWGKAGTALKVTGRDQRELARFWDACNSENEKAFNESKCFLLQGSVDKSVSSLAGVGESLFPEEVLGKLFRCLRMLGGEDLKDFDSHVVEDNIRLPRVVLVAGMGWSGSGAIFDYLAEFNKVTAVKGESPYLVRGEYSLRTIERSLDDCDALKTQLVSFFYSNVLGFDEIKQGKDLKAFSYARSRSLGRRQSAHFDAASVFCFLSGQLLRESDSGKRREIFSSLVKLVVGRFAISVDVPEGNIAIMDNVVPIQHISIGSFLENTDIYCCFRDPRSNYVALVRENPGFHQSVSVYAKKRADSLKKLSALVEKKSGSGQGVQGGCVIHKVQFERFILSEAFRDEMASYLGLDLRDRKKHSKLKPWESMRNVVLHQEHPDQEEIRLIEKELGEYCVEPCVRPLLEES